MARKIKERQNTKERKNRTRSSGFVLFLSFFLGGLSQAPTKRVRDTIRTFPQIRLEATEQLQLPNQRLEVTELTKQSGTVKSRRRRRHPTPKPRALDPRAYAALDDHCFYACVYFIPNKEQISQTRWRFVEEWRAAVTEDGQPMQHLHPGYESQFLCLGWGPSRGTRGSSSHVQIHCDSGPVWTHPDRLWQPPREKHLAIQWLQGHSMLNTHPLTLMLCQRNLLVSPLTCPLKAVPEMKCLMILLPMIHPLISRNRVLHTLL